MDERKQGEAQDEGWPDDAERAAPAPLPLAAARTAPAGTAQRFQNAEMENQFEPVVYRGDLGHQGHVDVMPFAGDDLMGGGGHGVPFQPAPFEQFWPQQAAPAKKDLDSAVREVVVPDAAELDEDAPPKAPGGWLEPNFHFLSNSHPSILFSRIRDVLDAARIDFVVKPAKYKYKCVCYRDGARLPFYVRIFSTEKHKQYAVEFQRRSGDIIHFAAVYREAKAVLDSKGLVLHDGKDRARQPVINFDDLPPLPPLDDEPLTTDDYDTTISCLLGMATSPCTDIQTQAIQAISQLSLSGELAKKVLRGEDSGFGLLVNSLGSETEDVHRCAASGLANLLEGSEDACRRLCAANGVVTLFELALSSDTPQVQRECARALSNLGKTLGASLVDEAFKTSLSQLANIGDTATRGHVLDLQAAVGLPQDA